MYKFKTTNNVPQGPHGWIQWKGTDLCMDVHCACGYHSHIDGEFVYFVRCPKCKRAYELDGHIKLVEVTDINELIEIKDSIKETYQDDSYFDGAGEKE